MGAKDIESGIYMASKKKRGCFQGRDADEKWLVVQKLAFLIWCFIWGLIIIMFVVYGNLSYRELELAMVILGLNSSVVYTQGIDLILQYLGWYDIPFPTESEKIVDGYDPKGLGGFEGGKKSKFCNELLNYPSGKLCG